MVLLGGSTIVQQQGAAGGDGAECRSLGGGGILCNVWGLLCGVMAVRG